LRCGRLLTMAMIGHQCAVAELLLRAKAHLLTSVQSAGSVPRAPERALSDVSTRLDLRSLPALAGSERGGIKLERVLD
jgi:hypothetical protein